MINPLLQGNQMNIDQMIELFKNNPQQAINQMMINNPQIQKVINWINQYGTPERAFKLKAQEMGVNPDEIINKLKNHKCT